MKWRFKKFKSVLKTSLCQSTLKLQEMGNLLKTLLPKYEFSKTTYHNLYKTQKVNKPITKKC